MVLTHFHMDHDGGLLHFPDTEVLVSKGELKKARGWGGRIRGYLPNRWPTWFDPVPIDLPHNSFGPFANINRLTADGSVIAVSTPGHTADHISVVVFDGDTTIFLAGDTSYNEQLMVEGKVDGVTSDEFVARASLNAIGKLAAIRPTVYLPTHDPLSAERLARRQFVRIPAA